MDANTYNLRVRLSREIDSLYLLRKEMADDKKMKSVSAIERTAVEILEKVGLIQGLQIATGDRT